jgi:hypothetical protein
MDQSFKIIIDSDGNALANPNYRITALYSGRDAFGVLPPE